MRQQQQERRTVNESQLREFLQRALRALRKNQGEMQQQSRRQQLCHDAGPIYFVVERIEFPAVVETVQNERHEAENVEVHSARRVPATDENENADEEVNQADDTKIIFRREWFGRR